MFKNMPCLVADFPRNRIRISRKALEELGYPSYVRLLINPEDRIIAVQVCDHHDARAHNLSRWRTDKRHCCEITSRSLLQSLLTCGSWDANTSYRMIASACLDNQMVTFRIDASMPIKDYLPG